MLDFSKLKVQHKVLSKQDDWIESQGWKEKIEKLQKMKFQIQTFFIQPCANPETPVTYFLGWIEWIRLLH